MLVALTLLPSLQAIPNSRLVLQSSELHRAPLSSTRFTSLDETDTNLGPKSLYSRTNLAQILFVRALVCRWMNNEPGFQAPENTGPWVNTTHPGVVSTDQPAQAIEAYGTKAKISAMTVKPFSKEPADEGCMSALFAATSEYFVTEKIQVQYVSLSISALHASIFRSMEKLSTNARTS